MREILFKGKRLDNGEWVEGDSLVHSMYKKGDVCIGVIEGLSIYTVDPNTVRQYTGLKDLNGKKIFEGDCLGEFGEDEDGNDAFFIYGIVTYSKEDGKYMLLDEKGHINDWTLEDEAAPENWRFLVNADNIYDSKEGKHG